MKDRKPDKAQEPPQPAKTIPFNEEAMAEGRKLGTATVELNAISRRAAWKEIAIKAVVDNLHSNQILRRGGVVDNVHTDCHIFGMKGKGGMTIKKSTISRWLTEEMEDEIYMEAIARIVAEKVELAVATLKRD